MLISRRCFYAYGGWHAYVPEEEDLSNHGRFYLCCWSCSRRRITGALVFFRGGVFGVCGGYGFVSLCFFHLSR